MYLGSLKIDTVFKTYDQVLGYDSDLAFPTSFSQGDRDAFIMMKFKALNRKISNGVIHDPKQKEHRKQGSGACDGGGGVMVPNKQAVEVGTEIMNQAAIEQFFLATSQRVQ
jgi:hypothetical protein